MFVGLEMQVRRAHVEGVEQHFVQELDDGRVLDVRCRRVVFLLGNLVGLEVAELEIAAPAVALHGFAGAFALLSYQALQLVGFDDDPIHA